MQTARRQTASPLLVGLHDAALATLGVARGQSKGTVPMSMTREELRERIAKLEAAIAAWLADKDALNAEYAADDGRDTDERHERATALIDREDAICEEAMATGCMRADFMQIVYERGMWLEMGRGEGIDLHKAWLQWRAANPKL